MKVPFFDKRILCLFYRMLSGISVLTSILFLFMGIDAKCKTAIGIVALAMLVLSYVGIWLHSNKRQSITLKINTSEVEVKFGDIFEVQADLKAIDFNEYFDTLVDDDGNVIAKSTLNGEYIEKFHKDKVSELDALISSDAHLAEASLGENASRRIGKKTKYKLGTICVVNDYLLIAFSRFDDYNKAYLEINDYINCLLNFWDEIDRVYAGRTVALPVLGSGITRFKRYDNISDQELLELIVWTFKVSRIKLTYPSKVEIVVYKHKSERINLLALKDLEV